MQQLVEVTEWAAYCEAEDAHFASMDEPAIACTEEHPEWSGPDS